MNIQIIVMHGGELIGHKNSMSFETAREDIEKLERYWEKYVEEHTEEKVVEN